MLIFEERKANGYYVYVPGKGVFHIEYNELEDFDPSALEDEKTSIYDFVGAVTYEAILLKRLSKPLVTYAELTTKCNLRCRHCYVDFSEEEMDVNFWKKILSTTPSPVIALTGGEPLVYAHVKQLLKHLKKEGKAIIVQTNGLLLEKVLPLLDPSYDAIQVSLDGLKETHERIRGEGTFEKTIENIEKAVSRGFHVRIAFTLLPWNAHELEKVKTLAKKLGAEFAAAGGAPLGRLSEGIFYPRVFDSPPQDISSVLSCSAGVSALTITPSGNVIPCPFFRSPVMGNVRKESIEEIWNKKKWSIIFRDLSGTECSNCPDFPKCLGGCPALAYKAHGHTNAPDPRCPKLRKIV